MDRNYWKGFIIVLITIAVTYLLFMEVRSIKEVDKIEKTEINIV